MDGWCGTRETLPEGAGFNHSAPVSDVTARSSAGQSAKHTRSVGAGARTGIALGPLCDRPKRPIICGVEVTLLGPTAVSVGEVEVDLGAPKQRALFAVLALYRGDSVSTGTIVEALWGEAVPASALATLHGYIYTLRRALDPDRAARRPSTVVVTTPTGYALHLPADALDTERLAAVVRRGAALAPLEAGQPWLLAVDPDAARAGRSPYRARRGAGRLAG